MSTIRRSIPVLAVCLMLALLSLLLDHGVALGVSMRALKWIGYVYFALLVLAPLIVYPYALLRGESLAPRIVLSLLPGFFWWLAEVAGRLEWHSLPEAVWLSLSPFNLLHLHLAFVAMGMAHFLTRQYQAVRGGPRVRHRPRRWAGTLALVVVPLIFVALTIFPFLTGYQRLFQTDLLPMPSSLPGPLTEIVVAERQGVATRRPNLVFILSDDHRWDFTGHAGHPFVETPALDRLAAEGVRFERAYVTSSLCSPSRASVLTGTYPHRHGVWNNFTPWSNENRTFLEYLGRAGYRTAFIGKWHMPGGLPELRGVDHFVTFTNFGGQGVYEWCPLVVDGEEQPSQTRYIATELTNRALAWMDEQGDQPFVLYLSHKNVHADFTADEPERGRYRDESVSIGAGSHPWSHAASSQYVHFSFEPLDSMIRRYGESITSMDREIGRVLDFLDDHGLSDDTLVIYTSDNGYQWGERQLVDKRWPYEASIRVPLLVRYPASGHRAGTLRDEIVMNVDVAPTALALAGIEVPAWMQGRSILPLLGRAGDGAAGPWRDEALYRYYFEPPYPAPTSRALLTDRYKLIEFDGAHMELYDLIADPLEQSDRFADPSLREVRQRLQERLAALERDVASP